MVKSGDEIVRGLGGDAKRDDVARDDAVRDDAARDGAALNGAAGDGDFLKMVEYMKAHWPSKVKEEWQVSMAEYPKILEEVVVKFTANKTKRRKLIRIAGLSGSGKTTQLLPAVEAKFESEGARPVLVAAREFVQFHPHREEIAEFYGEENLRKMTDEFSTIMMFLTLKELTRAGYDIILDVTLLDFRIEGILMKMISEYESMMVMVAISPEVAERHLSGRAWRHTKETEREFIRATKAALKFYGEKMPEMRMVLWNSYEEEPVFDGEIREALPTFEKYSAETEIPEHDEARLREAKITYLAK